MTQKAHAFPSKAFFIDMITKDISLNDCILDLLDNCLDGASKHLQRTTKTPPGGMQYAGYEASITLSTTEFRIEDNCGGITLDDAIDRAFYFGRRSSMEADAEYGIGLYGIGMKRAIFKMGLDIAVESSTEKEAFRVPIDVVEWARREQKLEDWDFDLEPEDIWSTPGTRITVRNLREGVGKTFGDAVFVEELVKVIERDYSFFLQKGFKVSVNTRAVRAYDFRLREGADFTPVRVMWTDEPTGVDVEIVAGMAGLPPDDDSAEIRRPDVEYYGWYVACNDRIVIAADKTDKTVWDVESFVE